MGLLELTRELVDIPSVSREEAAVLAHITSLMPASFPIAFESDAVAVFARECGANTKLVVIAGHTDTVPVENNVPGHIDGDTLYGRGACDMKGSLAVMIELARWMESTNAQPEFDVAFLFFGREEIGSDESALLPALEQSDLLRGADFALLMEPTANALELGCQGNMNLTLTFDGVSAHSARPWKGTNAIAAAILALQEFVSEQPNDVEIDGLTFREVASVVCVRGGNARNVIPASCEVDVNVRYAPIRTMDEAEAMWRERFESLGAKVTLIGNAPPAPVVSDNEFARLLLASGASAPMSKQGWTNAADFAMHNIDAVNFGPGDAAFAHKADEQISEGALQQSFDTMKAFVS